MRHTWSSPAHNSVYRAEIGSLPYFYFRCAAQAVVGLQSIRNSGVDQLKISIWKRPRFWKGTSMVPLWFFKRDRLLQVLGLKQHHLVLGHCPMERHPIALMPRIWLGDKSWPELFCFGFGNPEHGCIEEKIPRAGGHLWEPNWAMYKYYRWRLPVGCHLFSLNI